MQAPRSPPFTETHTMLSLTLLGPFQATLGGGAEMAFRTQKEQALLAFLVVEAGRAHRRDALAELLWPERPEGVARTSLRQALAGLRRAVGGRHLLSTRTTVRFNVAAEHWLDVAVYDAHWQAIRKHIHDAPTTCPICMGHRQQAVALYRGEFLSGLEANDSRDFQEWVTVHRERLFRQQAEALRWLTLYRRDLGDLERAGRYARRWVELDPLSERAHCQRMALLAQTGRRHDALAQYEACRRTLAEELGLEPGAETAALYEQIRDRRTRAPAARSPAAPQDNLPPLLTPTVGRKSEVAYLCRRFSQPDCRLLTVVGPGGVGKSRLALQTAEEVHGADLFADGVWFVPLETVPSPDLLAVTMAQALGMDLEAKQDPEAPLLDHLRPRTLLLVLDNFEHLLGPEGDEACDLVLEILQEAPGVKLLITSRERLNCEVEFLLDLDGLPYPTQDLSGWPTKRRLANVSCLTYPALQLSSSSWNGPGGFRPVLRRRTRRYRGWPASAGWSRDCRWASSWRRPAWA
jgi:DNA-binding SARP family transcriptional activator